MNCKQVRAELVACLDGELQGSVRSQVESHLHACPACRADYQAVASTIKILDQLPATQPTGDLLERFWKRFQEGKEPRFSQRVRAWWRWPRPLWVGAGVGVCLLSLVLLWLPREQQLPEADAAIATHLELFNDYEAIQQLEILEDLEYIEALDEV